MTNLVYLHLVIYILNTFGLYGITCMGWFLRVVFDYKLMSPKVERTD